MRAPPNLVAGLEACRELLADEPEMLADLHAVFAREPPRWELLPDDLQRGLADIAWQEFVARGLTPAGARRFIERRVRRCEACGMATTGEATRDCDGCAGTGQEFVERRGPGPPSLRVALLFAGDAAGVLAAEALAREAAVRLWPWRGRRGALPGASEPPQDVVWRVDEDAGPLELMRGTEALCPLLFEALLRRLWDGGRRDVPYALTRLTNVAWRYNRGRRWRADPAGDRAAVGYYDELARDGVEVPSYGPTGSIPQRLGRSTFAPIGRRFAALPNPFTPLCGLWDLEVAVERLEADAIVLARKA